MAALDAPHLIEFAHDLGGDEARGVVERALQSPPTSVEEVGFYGAENNPPLENCLRILVAKLDEREVLMASEDKYLGELFPQFEEHITLPRALIDLLPFWLDPIYDWEQDGSDPGVQERLYLKLNEGLNEALQALDSSFRDTNKALLTFELDGGDHLYFAALTPNLAMKWTGVALARNGRGRPLGLRTPDWSAFADHLSYALGCKAFTDVNAAPVTWRDPV